MGLRDTLRDHRSTEGDDRRFPGERRTTRGLFAGRDDRLVHVAPDGTLRDFGYPLSRLAGLSSAQLGVRVDGETVWFDDGTQRYVEDTALVVTEHTVGDATVTQYDLTLASGHITHVEWADAPADAALVALATFEPEGREDRVGQLHHDDAVEVYHAREHDFLASATGFELIEGRVSRLEDISAGADAASPEGRYEESHLAGTVHTVAPFADGSATLGSRLTTGGDRDAVLASLRETVADHSAETLRAAASPLAPDADTGLPPTARDAVTADLRAVSLLTAPSGLRVAGPDFDPFYAHSGGYGYTWFRDDSEVSRFLLQADRRIGLGLDDWHARSAQRHCEIQLDDGTWPHRVWPFDGSIAPGWANARIEAGDDVAYQADQTGSLVAFLASYLPTAPEALRGEIVGTLDAALDGLDTSLDADGRPERCQNAWENMDGRFAHTTATFLHGYSALADCAALPEGRREHAREQATRVYDALEELWVGDRYALREEADGSLDGRLDSATLALPGAHLAYDEAIGVGDARLDRLVEHVETTVEGLRRETDAVSGLVRFEGDPWRCGTQDREKLWTVSTGWGASACLELAELLDDAEDGRAAEFLAESRALLEPMLPGGSISTTGGYLPEQFFDDGTPDSATPLGWPHAIRAATVAGLAERDELGPLENSAAADD
ncbi:glucan 1,4-alpha-glucosidase [Halolamina sp.]|jgi:GH15 family glucan-1,4-alpha-glucosidase|uniref:glucan 1,4-alpha-glucosidase n=1 Tax=Halolamina sp. TaxID=1940283 RepID=UPI003565327A